MIYGIRGDPYFSKRGYLKEVLGREFDRKSKSFFHW
jgi:hypothetical protein